MKSGSDNKGVLLVVDDEVDFRDAITEILQPFAREVRTAGNGKDALKHVKSGEIDAVLTDINMPQMTGLQMLAEIRALLYQTPVIVLTGYGDMQATKEALRLDATDFLEKPCEPKFLKEAVGKALELGLALRTMEQQLDELYANTSLPADRIAQMRKIQRVTKAMKLTFSVYNKKAG